MVQIALNQANNDLFKNNKMPLLLYAGHIDNNPEWSFPSHKHDELCEIIYISEGEGDFVINNHPYRTKKDDIIVYNPGIVHKEKSNPQKPLKIFFCGIGNLSIEGLMDGSLIPSQLAPIIHAAKYSYKVNNYISNIFEEYSSQGLGSKIICQYLLILLIIFILRITTAPENLTADDPNSLGYRIKEYIDENYTCDISLNNIANHFYLSPYYISHIFKKEIGLSTINYLISRRIGEAKKLLLTSNATIEEISGKVGYENCNYFSILFKKITGTSPGRFRHDNREITV
jgi:AraC-like DNA-binding protein